MNALALTLALSLSQAPAAPPEAPPPPAAPAQPQLPPVAWDFLKGFSLGSYGRVGVGSDLRGALGRPANIVAHGPRLLEDPYAELELKHQQDFGAVRSRVVASLAFFTPFFHFTGEVDQRIALRNLYAEAQVGETFSVWGGSRMVRGDDVYLLDLRPLDDLNTVGGGAALAFGPTRLEAHVGVQRLDQPQQHQLVVDEDPLGNGAVTVTRLDRPRWVEALKLSHRRPVESARLAFSLYGEAHQLSAGVQRDLETGDELALPADWGVLFGAQGSLSLEGGKFVHLWVRQAFGLAVYDELSSPTVFANDRTTQGARSTRLAISAGWDGGLFAVLVGGYVDLVRDAGVSPVSTQKYDEGALAVRGQWAPFELFGVALEASAQRRVYALVDPATGALRGGTVAQFGLMPYFSPMGRGLFARPQLRAVYALTLRDQGARSFYPDGDAFSRRTAEHYLGLSVEWWFNSTTYPAR